jgi:hypothetical protein
MVWYKLVLEGRFSWKRSPASRTMSTCEKWGKKKSKTAHVELKTADSWRRGLEPYVVGHGEVKDLLERVDAVPSSNRVLLSVPNVVVRRQKDLQRACQHFLMPYGAAEQLRRGAGTNLDAFRWGGGLSEFRDWTCEATFRSVEEDQVSSRSVSREAGRTLERMKPFERVG